MKNISKKTLTVLIVFSLFMTSILSLNVLAEDNEVDDSEIELSYEVVENDKDRIKNKMNIIEESEDEDYW